MGEVSLETSAKNIMIQDMINSENSVNTTESTNTNMFKTKSHFGHQNLYRHKLCQHALVEKGTGNHSHKNILEIKCVVHIQGVPIKVRES